MEPVRTHIKLASPTPVYGKKEKGDFMTIFKKKFAINVISCNDEEIIFDMVGINAAIANAFRRILIAEVPTMAIEKVYISNNTSVLQDEVLSHRLGLIPLYANPRLFEYLDDGDDPTDMNTLVFRLNVKAQAGADASVPTTVHSKSLEWVPQGTQEDRFADDPVRPVHGDIVLAKLKAGQEITLEAHAVKGTGKEHAKWSPVATASYRLLPAIEVDDAITDELAEELVAKCPLKVFDIEDLGGSKTAVAARPRDCTVCRECIRGTATLPSGEDKSWESVVTVSRVVDHFIFSVESVGVMPAKELFVEAVNTLSDKASEMLEGLGVDTGSGDDDDDDGAAAGAAGAADGDDDASMDD